MADRCQITDFCKSVVFLSISGVRPQLVDLESVKLLIGVVSY